MHKVTTIQLFKNIKALIEQSKRELYYVANITLVETYYHVGRLIVEYEQQGSNRAVYAKETLKKLSDKLTDALGKGYSVDNLENMRKFYLVYKNEYSQYVLKNRSTSNALLESASIISETLSRKSAINKKSETLSRKSVVDKKSETLSRKSVIDKKSETLSRKLHLSPFKLTWSHYVFLANIDDEPERRFYEIEASGGVWSFRELKRQYNAALYQRLALSRNKKKVRELSIKGQVITTPADIIKDPTILEFIGFPEKDVYTESDLENAIISKLADFLKEMGKGFLFVERQKRIRIDDDDYRVDLVFYHRILQCFVLLDLKIGTLQHKDVGQMQLYVNYFDADVKAPTENKTIGIILCRNKKESTIKYTLGKDNAQIFAAKYKMYFPEKQLLKIIKENTAASQDKT
jgi:predicted nuclease of restriction endonuclease-like (RecB) superfamily